MSQVKIHQKCIPEKAGYRRTSYFGRTLMTVLSPGMSHSRLSILIYHRVLPQRDPLFPLEVDSEAFDQQMNLLKACFNVIPLADAVQGLPRANLPPRAACITFDDGYADNAEVALPILQKYDLPATFFIATGFLDGGRMWNDTVIELVRRATGPTLDLSVANLGTFEISKAEQRRQATITLLGRLKYLSLESRKAKIAEMSSLLPAMLPNDLMMTSGQVRKLHNAGMGIGGHTMNHPILAGMDAAAARTEIADGKDALESIIRAPVRHFAYPNGKPGEDYLSDHVGIVKSLGFEAAVSTAWGTAKCGNDLYQLPRFTPWDRKRLPFVMRMAQNMLRKPETV